MIQSAAVLQIFMLPSCSQPRTASQADNPKSPPRIHSSTSARTKPRTILKMLLDAVDMGSPQSGKHRTEGSCATPICASSTRESRISRPAAPGPSAPVGFQAEILRDRKLRCLYFNLKITLCTDIPVVPIYEDGAGFAYAYQDLGIPGAAHSALDGWRRRVLVREAGTGSRRAIPREDPEQPGILTTEVAVRLCECTSTFPRDPTNLNSLFLRRHQVVSECFLGNLCKSVAG